MRISIWTSLGFDNIELRRLLEAQDAAPGLTEEDSAPDVQPEPVADWATCLFSETTG